MVANNAQYDQSCRLKYNNTKLLRAQKRAIATSTENVDSDVSIACKRRRSQSIEINTQEVTFFVGSLLAQLVSMKQLHSRLMDECGPVFCFLGTLNC